MLNINGEKLPSIFQVFLMVIRKKQYLSFFIRYIITFILWKIDKYKEKQFDKYLVIDLEIANKKRLFGVNPNCFMEARAYAEIKFGELSSTHFKLTIEYYYSYYIKLFKIVLKEVFLKLGLLLP
jgi:hypothetical protein